jgi:hypothetical protein
MRATTILAIVAIVAALGAVTSLIPTQQVSAYAQGPPLTPPGPPESFPGGSGGSSSCGGSGGSSAHADGHPVFCRS